MTVFSQARVIYQIHYDIAFTDTVYAGIVLVDTCQRNCVSSVPSILGDCYVDYHFADGSVLSVETDLDGLLIPYWYDSVDDM